MKIFRLGFWLAIHVFLHCGPDLTPATQHHSNSLPQRPQRAERSPGSSCKNHSGPGTKDLPEADVAVYPWSAIGKLNNSIGGSYTAAVVEQDLALTAAHCIFNRRTGRFPAGEFAPLAFRI